jgi:hypothetical protein
VNGKSRSNRPWSPVPVLQAATIALFLLWLVTVGVALFLGIGRPQQPMNAGLEMMVQTDPRTLILQPGEYPSAWTPDLNASGPDPEFLKSSNQTPIDAYRQKFGYSDGEIFSTAALYSS